MNSRIIRKIALLLLTFSGCLYARAQAPANDNCSGAIELIPLHGNTCANAESGTNADATMSSTIPSCSSPRLVKTSGTALPLSILFV